MGTAEKALTYGFLLSLLLIAVVYFIGLSTDAGALAKALQQLIYSVTGRTSTGQFAAYPGGAKQPKAA